MEEVFTYVFPNKIPLSQVSMCLLEFRLESDVKRSQSLLIPVGKYLLKNISNNQNIMARHNVIIYVKAWCARDNPLFRLC